MSQDHGPIWPNPAKSPCLKSNRPRDITEQICLALVETNIFRTPPWTATELAVLSLEPFPRDDSERVDKTVHM